jgi:hypothetical protein
LTRTPKPFNGRSIVCNQWCWEKWISTCKRTKLDSYLTSYTEINSKWIRDLNLHSKVVELSGMDSYACNPRTWEVRQEDYEFESNLGYIVS